MWLWLSLGMRTLLVAMSGSVQLCELSRRQKSHQHQDPAPPNSLQAPALRDASGQATSRAGTQPHPPADRLPKDFLSCSHP